MSVAAIRAAEARAMEHTPESALMDRAAQGLAVECSALLMRAGIALSAAHVVILVGTGNNGGDALLAGALLARQGAIVTGVGVGATAHRRGLAGLRESGARWCDAHQPSGLRAAHHALGSAHMVVDGIVGIGSKPGLRQPAAGLVAAIPAHALVVAVDVPSGLDADSAALPHSYVQADLTVTFTALKPCLALPPARDAAGEIVVVDVGVEPAG
jgi:hydroxyethylthiazole kinase-like uncharacterized protein yjeF